MKRFLLIIVALLALPVSAFAQLAQGTLISTTVNPCVTATSLNQAVAVNIQITGTYSGTITFKGFSDIGRTFVSVTATNTSGFATGTTTTSTGNFTVTNSGFSQIQACMTSYASGGANVTITKGYGAGGSGGSGGGGGAVTIADGADVNAGSTTDPAVGDATGTMNAHLRQIAKTLVAGFTATGSKTSNAAIPSSTNLGVLPCIANAAAPTLTETFQVGCSTDLHGSTRATLLDSSGSAITPSAVATVDGTANTALVAGYRSGIAIPPVAALLTPASVSLTTNASISVQGAVGSNYLYITSCTFSNTTTTGTIVNLQNGSGGTTLWSVPVPAAAASSAAGAVVTWPVPLKVTTIGTALFAANATSTTTTISCTGFSSTVSY